MPSILRLLFILAGLAFPISSGPVLAQSARDCVKTQLNSSTNLNLYINDCSTPINFKICSVKVVDGDPRFVCNEGTAQPRETFGSLSVDAVINLSACEPPMRPVPITDHSYLCKLDQGN